jgi:hypothetical protein
MGRYQNNHSGDQKTGKQIVTLVLQ